MSYLRDSVAQLRELGISEKTAKYALEVTVQPLQAARHVLMDDVHRR